jgi:hypothetical protein
MDEARTAACGWIWSAALEAEEAGLRRLPRGASAAVPTEDAGAAGKGRRPVGRAKGPARVGAAQPGAGGGDWEQWRKKLNLALVPSWNGNPNPNRGWVVY